MTFEDREGQNLNRKRLKIVSKNDTEMVVDVERDDIVTKEGTKLNAQVLNSLEAKINSAVSNANNAYISSSSALELASKVCKAKFTLEGTVLTITDI